MSQKKFSFGYFYYPPPSKEIFLENARKAEGLGFQTLLQGDHAGWNMSPLPMLLAAANATKTLRVGMSLLGNDFYNPLWLAKEIATLDMLTDGRFDFGVVRMLILMVSASRAARESIFLPPPPMVIGNGFWMVFGCGLSAFTW